MRAIVTNLVLGSIASVSWLHYPVWADGAVQDMADEATLSTLSAKVFQHEGAFLQNPAFVFEEQKFDYFISLEEREYVKRLLEQSSSTTSSIVPGLDLEYVEKEIANLGKHPLLQEAATENLVLGTHNSFWQDRSRSRYWGITTVKTWGGDPVDQLSLKQLNYLNAPPLLSPGASSLTISGGSGRGLRRQNVELDRLGDFNGGVAFHQSLAPELTVGLGLVYEDLLLGFSQLTYQPEDFPLRTTVSLLQTEDGLEIFSHLKLQPSETMIFNFYGDDQDQKFDLNWGIASGLTLTADGNSEDDSLRAGAKLAVKNEWLSFLAQAQLDNNNEIQWKFNSRVGQFHLSYATDNLKTNSEVKYNLNDLADNNFQLSFFVKNQNRQRRNGESNLTVWGWDAQSKEKIARNVHLWKFNLGYGMGSEGGGAIASMGLGLNPALSLQLTYEEISLVSNDTRIRFQLSSN